MGHTEQTAYNCVRAQLTMSLHHVIVLMVDVTVSQATLEDSVT